MECLYRWSEYLDEILTFPIAAKVDETDGYVPVKEDDTATIKSLTHAEDLYGIIAEIRLGRLKYTYPFATSM